MQKQLTKHTALAYVREEIRMLQIAKQLNFQIGRNLQKNGVNIMRLF